MNLIEIAELRDKLRKELAVVEQFFEIAKAHGANGVASPSPGAALPDADQPRPAAPQPELKMAGLGRDYGALTETVFQAVKLTNGTFTIADLFDILAKIDKPLTKGQIGTVLNRLVRRDKILVHRRGKGSKGSVFKTAEEALKTYK